MCSRVMECITPDSLCFRALEAGEYGYPLVHFLALRHAGFCAQKYTTWRSCTICIFRSLLTTQLGIFRRSSSFCINPLILDDLTQPELYNCSGLVAEFYNRALIFVLWMALVSTHLVGIAYVESFR